MTRGPISKNVPGVRFTGTEGMIEVSRDHLITEPESLRRQQIGKDEIHLYESINHQDNFLQCIKTRKRTASDAEVGCRSVMVCHLGNIAYWLKRPLRWNPEKEEFVNDPEANKMRARTLRAPWRL
jgi:hypothetical protein